MSCEAELIFKKSKKQGAIYFSNECLKSNNNKFINQVLDIILNPLKDMADSDSIEWLKLFISSGINFQDFSEEGIYFYFFSQILFISY